MATRLLSYSHMEIIYIIAAIGQSFGVSLGVGSSTIAVVQFFKAIADGNIDESERRIMGVGYTVLRVAMGLILVSTTIHGVILYYFVGLGSAYFTPFFVGLWLVLGVIFLNALAMTKHWIPSSLGPAIQAGSWYTMGLMFALLPLGLISFTFTQFVLVYAGVVCLAIAIINGVTDAMKKRG